MFFLFACFCFVKYCSSWTCICKSCHLSPSFSLWLFFISWTLFPQVALSNSTRKAQCTPRGRHKIIQAVQEPLGMGCHRDSERRPGSATKRSRGQDKFWSPKKQAISLALHSKFSLKEPLLLIHQCQKYYSWYLKKREQNYKGLDLELALKYFVCISPLALLTNSELLIISCSHVAPMLV